MITPNQTRYIDPFSDVTSSAVNNRLKGVFTNSKACLYGLNISNNDLTVTVSSGVAIKDYVVLDFSEDMSFTVSESGTFYVVVKYVYQVTDPPPEAQIGYISEDVLNNNPDWYLIIGEIVSDGTTITSIKYDNRDGNPLSQFIQEYFTSQITSDLNMNNYKVINVADPVNPTDAVNKETLDAVVGEVKVDSDDSPDYLPQKFENGGSVSFDIDQTDPNNKKLKITALDEFIKVESADSGKSFI